MLRFLLLTVLLAGVAFAQPAPNGSKPIGCSNGKGEAHTPLGNGFVLNIRPSTEDMEAPCWAEILDASGKEVYGQNNYGVRLHEATGKDIDADGQPDVVIEGYSGGAHCCWTYGIVSLTNPVHAANIRNSHPIAFKETGGRIVLYTYDRAFDYFETDYADSPRADVYLVFRNNKFYDAGPQFREEYDRSIAEARQQLPAEKLEHFRAAGADPNEPEVKSAVLRIVLAYLYSGREAEAWKALEAMWPPTDRRRIQDAIVKAQAAGLSTLLSGKAKKQD